MVNRLGVPVAVGLTSLAVYAWTLCPDVYVEGSGELIGATYLLGTPHPTGYPLYALLGRVFAALAPWGPPAAVLNAFSALGAAAAVAVAAALLLSRGLAPAAAASASLCLGWGLTFWTQATIAEVYGFALLAASLLAWLVLKAAEGHSRRFLWASAYVAGLGATTHLNQFLLWPGLCLALLWSWPRLWRLPRIWGPGLGLLLLGYSVVLYLPARNGRGMGFHWSAIDGVPALWDHISGALYRSSFFSLNAAALGHNAWRWGQQVLGEYQVWGLPFVLVGVWACWRRDRLLGLVAGGALAANLVTALNYRRDPNGIGVFFLLGFWALALLMGYGLDRVVTRLGRAGFIVLLLPLSLAAVHWQEADRSGNDIAARYGRDILESLPTGAVLFTEGDDSAFIVDYLHRVEGVRPDIRLYNRMGRGYDLLDAEGRGEGPALQARTRRRLEAELIRSGGAPVFFQFARKSQLPLEGYDFFPQGLAYRLVAAEGRPLPPTDPPMANAERDEVFRDPWVRKLQANYYFMRAEGLRYQGAAAAAAEDYRRAATVADDSWSTRFNVGLMLYRLGHLNEAIVHARAALEIDPWRGQAYALAQRIERQRGNRAGLEELLKRAVDLGVKP